MAATITFRPRAGIREALDARCVNGQPDRTAVINAALAQYLGVEMSEGPGSTESAGMSSGETRPSRPAPQPDGTPTAVKPSPSTTRGLSRKRPARQAVPSPPGEEPPCPHPKEKIKKLQYGKQCTECGQMVR